MDRTTVIHRAFAGANVVALFAGLNAGIKQASLNTFLLFALLMGMRIKMWFDDEAYFDGVKTGKLPAGLPFGFGFVLAIVSWILWGFAGYNLADMNLCSLLMILVFIPSTFWIVAAMVKNGAYAEQIPWLFFNAFYGFGFFLLLKRTSSWNPFSADSMKYSTFVIVGLILLFFADLIATRILEQRRLQ